MHSRAAAFAEQAEELGVDVDVHEFPEGTKTAADAAEAVGCDVAQIASSIAMVADGLVVVVTSGANRVSERRLADLRGVDPDRVRMAEAEAVKDTLGWAIGGVPPFCHDTDAPVYVDETLRQFETVWAAAGTPQAVFPVDPEQIQQLSDATAATVAEE